MDCDAIAPVYRFAEYLAFGGKLQRHRLRFLEAARAARHGLVLGDGDGRFIEQLSASFPLLQTDVIELSKRMIDLAEHRVSGGNTVPSQVHFVRGDARSIPFPKASYDLFATHFFLDCFTPSDLSALVSKIKRHASPNALWIISEFRRPASFWRALHAELWLRVMYFLFRLATGLNIRRLPNHRDILIANGFELLDEETSMAQFIGSELWVYRPGGFECSPVSA